MPVEIDVIGKLFCSEICRNNCNPEEVLATLSAIALGNMDAKQQLEGVTGANIDLTCEKGPDSATGQCQARLDITGRDAENAVVIRSMFVRPRNFPVPLQTS